MAVVAGVDFGTLSVRVTLVDDRKGPLGLATAEYPLHRKRENPDYATQAHADHMDSLARAMRGALASAGVKGDDVAALAIDTTGSSVVMVGEGLEPLDEYYLWCDHRAKGLRPSNGAAASIRMNGASPSCCTGCVTTRKNATGW
jgi:L-ribulokinase